MLNLFAMRRLTKGGEVGSLGLTQKEERGSGTNNNTNSSDSGSEIGSAYSKDAYSEGSYSEGGNS
jgi:hypothetical protein